MADVKNVSSSATVKSPTVQATVQNQQPNILQDVLNFWPVHFLISFLPFGNVISDILSQIVKYVETIEVQVAEQGKGEWKKSLVEKATVKYILQQFPELDPLSWILSGVVDDIIDFIVSMKNRYGWDWIPFTN